MVLFNIVKCEKTLLNWSLTEKMKFKHQIVTGKSDRRLTHPVIDKINYFLNVSWPDLNRSQVWQLILNNL